MPNSENFASKLLSFFKKYKVIITISIIGIFIISLSLYFIFRKKDSPPSSPTINPPYTSSPTSNPPYTSSPSPTGPVTPSPMPSCNGRGTYYPNLGMCICNNNWSGKYCDVEPLCKGNSYMINGVCKCNLGWYGENCDSRTPPTPSIPSNGIPDSDLPKSGVDVNSNIYGKLRYNLDQTLFFAPFLVTRTKSDGVLNGRLIKGNSENEFYVSYGTDKKGVNLNYSYIYYPNNNSILEVETTLIFT